MSLDAAEQPIAERRRLRNDVFMTFANKATVLSLQLISTVIIARELGPSGRGALAVAVSLALILVQVGTLGLASANPYLAAKDPALRRALVANSIWVAVLAGGLLAGFAVGLRLVAPGSIAGVTWPMLAIAAAAVPTGLAMIYLQAVLLGLGRAVAYNAIEAGLAVLAFVALVAGFALFDMGIVGTVLVQLSNYLLGGFLFAIFLMRRGDGLPRPDLALMRRTFSFAGLVYAATLVQFLVLRVDQLLVNGYQGRAEAGHYALAVSLAEALFVLPYAVGLNLFPRIAQGGDPLDTARVLRVVGPLFGLVCAASAAAAIPAIPILFGEPFRPSIEVYLWLMPGVFCLGMLTMISQHFIGTGYPPVAIGYWVAGLVLNVVLNVVLLPGRGPWIASLTSSLAYALVLVLHVRLFAGQVGGYGPLRPRLGESISFVRVALRRSEPSAPP